MPANLTPQYFKAEERYRLAQTDKERIEALKEMLSTIPKHKGTEKLQADLKRKLAQLKTTAGKKTGVRRAASHAVERSGSGQVAIVGPANVGKSRFVRDLTHAEPDVQPYPGTTWTPTPGIAIVNKIPLQLIDLPALQPEHVEPWHLDLIRNADLLLVLLDLGSDDLLEEWENVLAGLERCHVTLGRPPPLHDREIGVRYVRAVRVGNKADLPGAADRLTIFEELEDEHGFQACSLETGEGLPEVLDAMVEKLGLIRVFTKQPHEEADMGDPFVLREGSTVADVARLIHKELAEHMKFARAWGGAMHDGQPVGRDQVLEDGVVLEFHE